MSGMTHLPQRRLTGTDPVAMAPLFVGSEYRPWNTNNVAYRTDDFTEAIVLTVRNVPPPVVVLRLRHNTRAFMQRNRVSA